MNELAWMPPMMNSYAIALLVFWSGFGIVACGSTDAPATGANGGAAGNAGGNAGGAGNASGAGHAGIAGGITGGGPSVAGSGGSIGSSGTGGTAPTGTIIRCTGTGCPYGECDDNGSTTCQSVYPPEGAVLCKGDDDYCLVTGTNFNSHSWVVQCTSGNASSGPCVNGCSHSLGTAECSL